MSSGASCLSNCSTSQIKHCYCYDNITSLWVLQTKEQNEIVEVPKAQNWKKWWKRKKKKKKTYYIISENYVKSVSVTFCTNRGSSFVVFLILHLAKKVCRGCNPVIPCAWFTQFTCASLMAIIEIVKADWPHWGCLGKKSASSSYLIGFKYIVFKVRVILIFHQTLHVGQISFTWWRVAFHLLWGSECKGQWAMRRNFCVNGSHWIMSLWVIFEIILYQEEKKLHQKITVGNYKL